DFSSDAWRPTIVTTVGTTSDGAGDLWRAIDEHRQHATTDGSLAKRRDQRLRNELREIIVRRLEYRAREICTGDRWEEIQNEMLSHSRDPWSSADEMLHGIL
ncbi:MAG: methylmalonyl Co-A mutase-associated GTPase MeaB, partial [Actinomycetota bacterium]